MNKEHKLLISVGVILAASIYNIKKRLASNKQNKLTSQITCHNNTLNSNKVEKQKETLTSQQKLLEIVERFQMDEVQYPTVDLQLCVSCAGNSHSHNLKQV